MTLNGPFAQFIWKPTTGSPPPANTGLWTSYVDGGGNWRLEARNDTQSNVNPALFFGRTSGTSNVTTMAYGTAADKPAHLFSGNVTANGTIFANGKPTYNANAAGVTIGNDTGFGLALFTAGGSTPNQNNWQVFASPSGHFVISTLNDGGNTSQTMLDLSRSDVNPGTINAFATQVNINAGTVLISEDSSARIVIASNLTQPAYMQVQSNGVVGGYFGVSHGCSVSWQQKILIMIWSLEVSRVE